MFNSGTNWHYYNFGIIYADRDEQRLYFAALDIQNMYDFTRGQGTCTVIHRIPTSNRQLYDHWVVYISERALTKMVRSDSIRGVYSWKF